MVGRCSLAEGSRPKAQLVKPFRTRVPPFRPGLGRDAGPLLTTFRWLLPARASQSMTDEGREVHGMSAISSIVGPVGPDRTRAQVN